LKLFIIEASILSTGFISFVICTILTLSCLIPGNANAIMIMQPSQSEDIVETTLTISVVIIPVTWKSEDRILSYLYEHMKLTCVMDSRRESSPDLWKSYRTWNLMSMVLPTFIDEHQKLGARSFIGLKEVVNQLMTLMIRRIQLV